MEWYDVEDRLCEHAEEVCRHLLPNGKRDGAEWVAGSLGGEAGKSLKVNLGGKVGLWRDFAGDGGGKTLMSLWTVLKGGGREGFKLAIREAKGFLGIKDDWEKRVRKPRVDEIAGEGQAAGNRTERSDRIDRTNGGASLKNFKGLTENCAVWLYLTEVRRLDPIAILAYGIGQSLDGLAIVYPYFAETEEDVDGPIVAPGERKPAWLKFELLARDAEGKKREWTTPGPEKCLFGKPAVLGSARSVVITEGEKDAVAWGCYGIAAVSVPFGAKWRGQDKGRPSPNREWIDRDWKWLESFETIFVSMDSDEAGKRAARDIINEIGPRRCRLVALPRKVGDDGPAHKDANECLMNGVTAEEMRAALAGAQDFSPDRIKSVKEFGQEFYESWFESAAEEGLEMPFEVPVRVRMGELTTVTGFDKHGKSKLLNLVIVGCLRQGELACLASLEVRVRSNLRDLGRQAWGGRLWDHRQAPKDTRRTLAEERAEAEENLWRTFRWLSERLWVYDHVGIVKWQVLLDDFLFVRRRYGVRIFVIDSLMRMGLMDDDYAGQAQFVSAAAQFAQDNDLHIFLVAHRKKSEHGERRGGGGDKSGVGGSGKITANSHNIWEVWRNVEKGQDVSDLREELRTGGITQEAYQAEWDKLEQVPDGKYILRGQRDAEIQEGSWRLWYIHESFQYVKYPPKQPGHRSVRFVE